MMSDTSRWNQSPIIILGKAEAFVFGHNDAFIPSLGEVAQLQLWETIHPPSVGLKQTAVPRLQESAGREKKEGMFGFPQPSQEITSGL